MRRSHFLVLSISGVLAMTAGALHAGILFLFGEPPDFLKVTASCFAVIYDVPARFVGGAIGHGYHFPFVEMTHAEFIGDWIVYMVISFLCWGSVGLLALRIVSFWKNWPKQEQ